MKYADRIASALKCSGIGFIREYKFLKKRKLCFDFLITSYHKRDLIGEGIKIAIEYEGGVTSRGRHTRTAGYNKDCEKYNLAALNNFIVLRYTSIVIGKRNGEYLVCSQVQQIIEQINSKFREEVSK